MRNNFFGRGEIVSGTNLHSHEKYHKLANLYVTSRTEVWVNRRRTIATSVRHDARLCYNALAMLETYLVPQSTVVSAKGDGPAADLSRSANRVFLLSLEITNIVEQEAIDVSIYGSSDGSTWGAKPIASFPQKFYRAEHPLLLDLTQQPDVKFVRAHWEVNRWGRGTEVPMFEFQLSLKEVPADLLKEATAEARMLG